MNELCFGYIGVCYVRTPLAVREQVSFTDTKKIELWQHLQKIGVEQCIILSTCNRSGIFFFFVPENTTFSEIRGCYQAVFSHVSIAEYLEEKTGEDAISYLFRVAAGLESLVLGEDQILGQVGDAMDEARTMGHGGKEINKVVREAVACAKRIKTTYRISEHPLSVSYVGIQLLAHQDGIRGRRVLVIGSGKTAQLALTYLYEYGAASIALCSRTLAHAKDLRCSYPDLTVIPYQNRYETMADCDIVVTATASPHLVVREPQWSAMWERRTNKSITFLDLATPRDVDPKLSEIEGVRVIDMDSIQRITAKNQQERERLAAESQGMIEEAVSELSGWLRASRMDATIETLQKRCQGIVEDSSQYLNRKLALNDREKKLVKKVLHSSLQRLLREPIQELRQLEDETQQQSYQKMVEQLFRMDEGGDRE